MKIFLAILLFAFVVPIVPAQTLSSTNFAFRTNRFDNQDLLLAEQTNRVGTTQDTIAGTVSNLFTARATFGTWTNYGTNRFETDIRVGGAASWQDEVYTYGNAGKGFIVSDLAGNPAPIVLGFANSFSMTADPTGILFKNGGNLRSIRAEKLIVGGTDGIWFQSGSNDPATSYNNFGGIGLNHTNGIAQVNWLSIRGVTNQPGNLKASNVWATGRFTNDLGVVASGGLEVGSGVAANGGGLKHGRQVTGNIVSGGAALLGVSWGTSFADTNYTATVSIVDGGAGLQILRIATKTVTQVTMVVTNAAGVTLQGEIQAIAIHD
jgi:hypothetical protein